MHTQSSIQDKGRIYGAHKREDVILLGRQLGVKEHTVRAMIETITARDGKLSVRHGVISSWQSFVGNEVTSLSVITQAKCLKFYSHSVLFTFKAAIHDADL